MQQVVFDFEREKRATGTEHAERFTKSAFLRGARAEMVQHEDRNNRGKSALCEREEGGVTLYDSVSISCGQASRERMTPLETRHAGGETVQGFGACARASPKLEHMVAERISGNNPWH